MFDITTLRPEAIVGLAVFAAALAAYWRLQASVSDQPAVLLQRLALLIAFVIASLPTLHRSAGYDFWPGLAAQLFEQAWIVGAMLLVRPVVDWLLLPRVRNRQAMADGNLALALLEAGFYMGFGCVLAGSLSGTAPSVGLLLAATAVFTVLGLLAFTGVYLLHEAVTPWSIRRELADGNWAAGIEAGSTLAALGIIAAAGVQGDFTGWGSSISGFIVTVAAGCALLYLFRWLLDLVVLRGTTIRQIVAQRQAGPAAILGVMLVLLATGVHQVLLYQL